MTDYLTEVTEQAVRWDLARARSQQREAGWSEMASCRSYLGFKVRGEWATDDEDKARAIVGTALHEWLTKVRASATLGTFGFEIPVEYGGVMGHIDEVDLGRRVITDYKFPSKNSARLFDDPEVIEEKFIQVQGYAAGFVAQSDWPDDMVTVRLLVCPVDGTFEDWRMYERPFDREAAQAALVRYGWVKEAIETGEELPKDKPYRWCERYCEFFRACRGPDEDYDDGEITDPESAAAVEAYGLANEAEAEAKKAKEQLAPLIRGLRGTARGWKVRMSRAGSGKLVVDEAEMARHYQDEGLRLPMRSVDGAPAKLLVSRVKR